MNEEIDYENAIAELAQKYDLNAGDYPESPTKDNQLQFMRDVVDEEDSLKQAKTANLNDVEAGNTKISVLNYLKIARYAETEGLNFVSEYLESLAIIISGVSLGRKAKLIDTLFTVRRETRNLGTPRETTKKGLFTSTTVREGVE